MINALNGVMLDLLILYSETINKKDKEIEATLDYRGINFPMNTRYYEIIEEKFNGYENRDFPLYVSKKFNE